MNGMRRTPGPATAWSDFASSTGPRDVRLDFHVTLITPMFGGGVHAGESDALQRFLPSGIRGTLRWWWRILAHGGDFDLPVGADLRELENAIWGSVSEHRPRRSGVDVVVRNVEAEEPVDYDRKGAAFEDLHYAYFPAEPDNASRRKLLMAGAEFDLSLRFADPGLEKMLSRLINAWALFGGIGGRTRRGAGAVLVKDGQGLPIALPMDPALRCGLLALRAPVGRAADAHRSCVKLLQQFRQGVGIARLKRRSRWPESHAVRTIAKVNLPGHEVLIETMAFPRASFGMPLVIKFKRDQAPQGGRDVSGQDPAPRSIEPPASTRMSSPLLIRPVPVVEQGVIRYRPAAFRLLGHPVDQLTEVAIRHRIGEKVIDEPLHPTWNAGWRPGTHGQNDGIRPLELAGVSGPPVPTNAVDAFMNFFSRQP